MGVPGGTLRAGLALGAPGAAAEPGAITAFGGTAGVSVVVCAAGAAGAAGATGACGTAGTAGAMAGAAGCAGRLGDGMDGGGVGIGGRGVANAAGVAALLTGVELLGTTVPGAAAAGFGVVAPIGGRNGREGDVRPPKPRGGVNGARSGWPVGG